MRKSVTLVVLAVLASFALIGASVLADTQVSERKEVRLDSADLTCQDETSCDAPSVYVRFEVGGTKADTDVSDAPDPTDPDDVPVDRCVADALDGDDSQDPACQPQGPGVDPGVLRLYFGVAGLDEEEAQPASYEPEAASPGQAPSEGLSPEMQAALLVGALGIGASGAVVATLGLRRIMTFLVAPLAARLQPNELLDDDTRRAIYQTIREDPGINLRGLATELELAWGTLLHHLQKLEKAHIVVSKRYGKYRRYFVNGSTYSPEEKERLAALSTPSTARVAEYILEHPGSTQAEVGDALDVTPSTVLWHARRLKDVGLVEAQRDGRFVRYFPQITRDERDALASSVGAAAA